jgi:hypothetical protein
MRSLFLYKWVKYGHFHFMYYNFVRIYQSLRVTPAMEAGLTDRLWTMEDIARLAENVATL